MATASFPIPVLGNGQGDEGSVRVMARWKCSSTIFSGYLDLVKDTPHADGATYRSSLDQRDVLGPVTVSVFAVAVRPISDFRWSRQHEDYGDETFDVRTGDLLSVPTDFTFDPAKLYDPQNPPLNSTSRSSRTTGPRPRESRSATSRTSRSSSPCPRPCSTACS